MGEKGRKKKRGGERKEGGEEERMQLEAGAKKYFTAFEANNLGRRTAFAKDVLCGMEQGASVSLSVM